MEWITAVLGALVAVLAIQAIHWRKVADLQRRIRNLEAAVADIRDEGPTEDTVDYGPQCVDLSDEWAKARFADEDLELVDPEPYLRTNTPLPLPNLRGKTQPEALSLLRNSLGVMVLEEEPPRFGISYTMASRYLFSYRREVLNDLRDIFYHGEHELTSYNRPELERYEIVIEGKDER